MSLRAKVLFLFLTLAVLPLAAITIFDYLQSVQSLEGLVRAQNRSVAEVASRELGQLYARRGQELDGLLRDPSVPRLLRAGAAASSTAVADDWRRLGDVMSGWLVGAELVDGRGRVLARSGAPAAATGDGCPGQGGRVVLVRTARLGREATPVSVRAVVEADAVFPAEALSARVGAAGFTAVVDRNTGEVLFRGRCDVEPAQVAAVAVPGVAARGTTEVASADGLRFTAVDPLPRSDWAVISSVVPDEFTRPFARARFVFVLLVLFVGAATSLAFAILLGRITRSLRDLTEAAGEVAAGNFTPALPPPGSDEVGRLSYSIGMMAGRVQRMLSQIESTRQLATMGEFAGRVSHEIRNPLSSIRLNLQGMERDVRKGRADPSLREPLEICLKEVERLDRVVRGMLALARSEPMRQKPFSVHGIIREASGLLGRQLEQEDVVLETRLEAERDTVVGDEAQLRGVVMNLVLNGAQAMEAGGTVRVRTATDQVEGRRVIRVHVADEGPGVPHEARDHIFRPFVTTKSGGTGLGLPIARRTAEQHGGTLYLEHGSALQRGAEFVLLLPLAADADVAAPVGEGEVGRRELAAAGGAG